MKQIFYFLLCLILVISWSSCRDDFEFISSTGNLTFSKDTVYLNTVFANIGSSTYNLRVYNRSDDDISIPSIRLGNGQSSSYRLNIDGLTGVNGNGKEFENVEILANDSMYVFIETTYNTNTTPIPSNEFLLTDKIKFNSTNVQQTVDLVTLIKDAVFIYPDRDGTTGVVETLTLEVGVEQIETKIQGRFLMPTELTFTNDKPYVIYGYAAVPNGDTLTVNAGARVHFHAGSGIIVSENASIQVNGNLSTDSELLENEVIFEGDRLEPLFADLPGQWGTIWLFENSINNSFNYSTIKNGVVGILSDGNQNAVTNKLTITNSQIYNSSNFGILGRNTSITAENLVINNSGQSSFAGTLGGKYNFTHCTIANYWNNSFRQFPSLLLNNFVVDGEGTALLSNLTEANFNNCIIYGNDTNEILLDELEDTAVSFNFKFTNCLIRFEENSATANNPYYDFNDTTLYEDVILNLDPNFREAINANDLIIGDDSAANGEANNIFANQVPLDILGENRTALPDIGAYQHITFE